VTESEAVNECERLRHDGAAGWLTPQAADLAERVADVINDAIGRADPQVIGGPVNWADLGCVGVSFDTDGCVEAIVSEASPDAHQLQSYLVTQLRAAGIDDVGVRCEW
jgi:hypothetical protein